MTAHALYAWPMPLGNPDDDVRGPARFGQSHWRWHYHPPWRRCFGWDGTGWGTVAPLRRRRPLHRPPRPVPQARGALVGREARRTDVRGAVARGGASAVWAVGATEAYGRAEP